MLTPEMWEFLRKAGILTGLCGAAIGFAWFCFATVNRIGILESQMQALTITAPKMAISVPTPAGVPPMQQSQGANQSAESVERVNPIVKVCADLAMQLSKLPYVSATDATAAAMDKLNCRYLKN